MISSDTFEAFRTLSLTLPTSVLLGPDTSDTLFPKVLHGKKKSESRERPREKLLV